MASRIPCFLYLAIATIITTVGMQAPAFSGGPDPKEGNTQEESKTDQTFVFTCDDGFEFVARTGARTAWLFLQSETVKLTKDSADEFRSENVTFRIKGQTSVLEEPEGKHLDCRNDLRLAIWEHAKLNGADFRAVGNEPGWHLEIRDQAKIFLTTDYGTERNEFELPAPVTDATTRTTHYKANLDGQEMTLTISGETCRDTMSGEEFESKVEVVFKGKNLRGCGRALH